MIKSLRKIGEHECEIELVSFSIHIPEIVIGNNAKNVWNMDETGCFLRPLPNCNPESFK